MHASARVEPGSNADHRRALHLVRLWRRAPLTLLLRDAQTHARAFVGHCVLPLTARRTIDRAAAQAAADRAPPVTPTAPRAARRPDGGLRRPELVLHFDAAGHADPAGALRRAWWASWPAPSQPGVGEADALAPATLWQTASALHAASDARVLLLLDGLADWLVPRNDPPLARQGLLDELASVLADASLDAHALLVLDEWAHPLLDTLWRRMPGLARDLRLMDVTPPIPDDPPPATTGRLHVPSRAAAPGAAAARRPPLPSPDRPALPPLEPASSAPVGTLASAVVAGCLVLAAGSWLGSPGPPKREATPPARPTLPAARREDIALATTPPVPDAPRDLARVLSAAGVDVAAAQGDENVAAVLAQASGGALALLRYDALTAAAAQPQDAGPPLELLAPLYTESLHVVVRTDSPLRAVHELAGARAVNVGPQGSARASTAAAAWSSLFGARWRDPQADRRPEGSALPALLAGEVEAVVLVGDALLRRWAVLTPQEQRALRLLPLDPRHPSTRRAGRRFLAASLAVDPLQPAGARQPGLAVMTFLARAHGDGDDVGAAVHAAQALCVALPELRRGAAPAWRDVHPARTLPAPWPYADEAVQVFEQCDPPDAPSPAASNPSPPETRKP